MKTLTLALAQTACLLAADEKKTVSATCPVDGHRFTAIEIVKTNHWGGVDADFCPHAFKTTPLEYFVWTCPSCGFTGKKEGFEAALSDPGKEAIRGALRPLEPIRTQARQNEIPGYVKYDLLAQTVRARSGRPEELGRAYLHAAWSFRQQGAVSLESFEEWEEVRTSYGLNQSPLQIGLDKNKKPRNRADFDLDAARRIEKDLQAGRHARGPLRTLSRYLAAYLYRLHGENAAAEKRLEELESMKGENSVIDDAAARMKASIPREREFLGRAAQAFRAALDQADLTPRVSGEIAYILGEIHRRLGQAAPAREWYRKAIDTSDVEGLRDLARRQKALVE